MKYDLMQKMGFQKYRTKRKKKHDKEKERKKEKILKVIDKRVGKINKNI